MGKELKNLRPSDIVGEGLGPQTYIIEVLILYTTPELRHMIGMQAFLDTASEPRHMFSVGIFRYHPRAQTYVQREGVFRHRLGPRHMLSVCIFEHPQDTTTDRTIQRFCPQKAIDSHAVMFCATKRMHAIVRGDDIFKHTITGGDMNFGQSMANVKIIFRWAMGNVEVLLERVMQNFEVILRPSMIDVEESFRQAIGRS